MNPQEPSNADLYEKMGKLEAIQVATLEQVQKTNGRVTRLERWRDKIDVIEVYKKENGVTKFPGEIDWQKLMLASLGLVATSLAIISFLAQR
jgi:hypothetical protein